MMVVQIITIIKDSLPRDSHDEVLHHLNGKQHVLPLRCSVREVPYRQTLLIECYVYNYKQERIMGEKNPS